MCADDFGLAPRLSEAICELIAGGRLSATSCMVDGVAWQTHATGLQALAAQADVGLHLTLTDQRTPLPSSLAPEGRLPPLGRLLMAALARRLSRDAVRAELERQLARFEEVWGGPPDFVDGHQHVHVLPGVREVLVEVLLRRYGPRRVYVRDCHEPWSHCVGRRLAVPKAVFISTLAAGLARLLAEAGMVTNQGFSGLHDFSASTPFRARMQAFLRCRGPRHLVHVHPGRVDAALVAVDSLTEPRVRELDYLASEAFIEDLALARARPGRMREIVPG